ALPQGPHQRVGRRTADQPIPRDAERDRPGHARRRAGSVREVRRRGVRARPGAAAGPRGDQPRPLHEALLGQGEEGRRGELRDRGEARLPRLVDPEDAERQGPPERDAPDARRAVTLMELMDAFDEARRDAEIQMQLNALREAAVRKFAPNFHQKVHGEDLTEDIALTWHRITQFNGEPIPLRHLTAGGIWDEVTVFMALLFLASLAKVKVWQKDFPHGEIDRQ